MSARTAHMYVIGMSGKGKTKLLEHCLYQDIAAGRGCGLIDPHSLLVDDLLRLLVTRQPFVTRHHFITEFEAATTRLTKTEPTKAQSVAC